MNPRKTRWLISVLVLAGGLDAAVAQVVRVAPIIRRVPTSDASVRFQGVEPPPSDPQVDIGGGFFVEIWATNSAEPQGGLACVYVDVHYAPTDLIDPVEPAQDSPLFPIDPVLPSFDDASGLVATTGGCQAIPVIDLLGVNEWVLIKRIEMSAGSQGGPVTVDVADSNDVIAAISIIGELNAVSPDDIDFQSRSFHVGDPPAPVPAATSLGAALMAVLIIGVGSIAVCGDAALHPLHDSRFTPRQ